MSRLEELEKENAFLKHREAAASLYDRIHDSSRNLGEFVAKTVEAMKEHLRAEAVSIVGYDSEKGKYSMLHLDEKISNWCDLHGALAYAGQREFPDMFKHESDGLNVYCLPSEYTTKNGSPYAIFSLLTKNPFTEEQREFFRYITTKVDTYLRSFMNILYL